MKKGNIELIPKKLELFGLIFTIPLNQIYSQSTKLISKLKTQRLRPEKVSVRRKLTWGCFVKNSLFDSLFLVNLSVFPWDFCVLKINHLRLLIVWKRGFGTIPRWCGIRPKPQHKCRKLVLYSFLKIAMHA